MMKRIARGYRAAVDAAAIAVAILVAVELVARAVFPAPEQATRSPRVPIAYPSGTVASISDQVLAPSVVAVYRNDRAAQLEPFPYTELHGPSDFHGAVVNLNRNGFRAPDMAHLRADPRRKVILLGGSGMWGAGASSDETTIGGYLQARLDGASMPLQVVNLAMPGFQTSQELITFARFGLALDAAWVIVMDGGNDINHAMWQDAVGDPALWAERQAALQDAKERPAPPLVQFVKQLRIVELALRATAPARPATLAARDAIVETRSTAEIADEIVRQYARNIASIEQLANANHVRPVFVLQPSVATVTPGNPLEAKLGSPPFFVDVYRRLLAAHLAQRHASFINGGEVFNAAHSAETKIVDEFHYTDLGNRLLADRLFAEIARRQDGE